MRHREVKSLAQGLTADKQLCWDVNSDSCFGFICQVTRFSGGPGADTGGAGDLNAEYTLPGWLGW